MIDKVIVICLVLLASGLARAGEISPLQAARAEANRLRLHEAEQWRRLLHYQPGANNSEVLSPDFFLSSAGRTSPDAELEASLEAWFASASETPDADPRCRFPARFAWLKSTLHLPPPQDGEPHCAAFEAWARPQDLRSISVMMISGYLGNPASSFGHAVLKLNHHQELPGGRLLDLSFNFGADVPEHEPMPIYLAYGLFGGYRAGFSVGAYYTRDQVYVHEEFRDIWEYELALTPEQRLRIAAHLWELRGQKFTYYFLSQNCAYRLAELITLATEQPYTPAARIWFTPVELFHRLAAPMERPEPLVSSIRFLPSSQRTLYGWFGQLSDDEAALVNDAIRAGPERISAALEGLAPQRQLEVIDTLLAWYEYRLASTSLEQADPAIRAAKDSVLRLRLALPPRETPVPAIAAPIPPSAGSPPMLGGAGIVVRGNQARGLLRFAPYSQDLLGAHSAQGVELKVLEAQARFGDASLRLDRLDVVAVRRLAAAPDIAGENRMSWHAAAGLRRQTPVDLPDRDNPLLAQITGGVGRAIALGPAALGYAGLDATALSGGSPLRGGPIVGMTGGASNWRARAELGGAFDGRDGDWSSHVEIEARLSLRPKLELRAGWQTWEGESETCLVLHRYW